MTKRRFSRSVARYIRGEKARIRKTVPDPKERAQQIAVLGERFVGAVKQHAGER
ncbi:hypothetical protein HY478_02620 [Candidatus Uhrbacteria bacterium]|nr:hypothetical protein [Candidatus Uhrbacteria bacterium]